MDIADCQDQLYRQRICDFHARLVPHGASVEHLLRTMDDVCIERAVVSAGGTIPLERLSQQIVEGGSADVDADNDFVLDACIQSEGRLVPFFLANPHRGSGHYRARVDEFSGLELAPAVHGVALTDDRTTALVRVADDAGHPVYLHCLARDGFTVKALVVIASRFPSVRFVLGHSGIGHIDLYGVNLISGRRNIFFETSGGYARVIQHALERLGPERLLFGSEYPLQHPTVELAKYRSLNLGSKVWERIAWTNASKLLSRARQTDNGRCAPT